ncbi:12-oxophytodienoate reductase 1 [Hypoxylon sp. FL1284]|nr:12-oxophytodienoate reductase 1 [Hypoxylon sp. FL1284]
MSNPTFSPLKDTRLFSPLKLGNMQLEHRVAMAPCTRLRGIKESDGVHVPDDLMVEYYGQRACKGGLLITEATDIAHYASGYPGATGIYSSSQTAAWKKVTDAVHAKGGYIFLQIWHTGRASPPSFRGGKLPVSASTHPMGGSWVDGTACEAFPPTPMTVDEIHAVTQDFAQAAKNAVEAGFDGVEIHSANGYLLDQFINDNINDRTDEYGGSIEKRCRFPLEVIKAVTDAIGSDKVGIRLTPWGYFQDTMDSDRLGHWSYLCEQIAALPVSNRPIYVHMIEARFDEGLDEQEKIKQLEQKDKAPEISLTPFREILLKGNIVFLAAGCFNWDNAAPKLKEGAADIICFGRWYIANPDLPKRLAEGIPLNPYDRATFYGAEPPSKGYTDYPYHA